MSSAATFDVTAKAGFHLAGGQTLRGNGTVLGATVVDAGATVAPGDAATGTLTLASGLDMSTVTGPGVNLAWRLGNLSTVAGNFDSLSLTGGNLVLGGALKITLDFSLLPAASRPDSALLDPFWSTNESWKVIGLSGHESQRPELRLGRHQRHLCRRHLQHLRRHRGQRGLDLPELRRDSARSELMEERF